MKLLLLLLVLVLVLAWWWQRRKTAVSRNSGTPRLARPAAQQPSAFHAVSIKTAPYACEAARKLEGKRILASEAPRLPLPECGRDSCECRFQHYADRRSGRDRRSPFGSGGLAAGTGSFEQERRGKDGRRADD